MSKKSAAASYLFLDRSGYYFRICIPLDLLQRFGQKEFRYTLKTRSPLRTQLNEVLGSRN